MAIARTPRHPVEGHRAALERVGIRRTRRRSVAPCCPDEQFSLVQNSKAPRTFSGKVVIDGPLTGVEVGLVSLVGVHWVNPDAYQWQAVNPDGTFSLTDAHYPTAPKALVVRGPPDAVDFFALQLRPQRKRDRHPPAWGSRA